MPRRDPVAPLQDMLDYALKAVRFCKKKSPGDLEQDEVLQFAVVRALELVGEAASRVLKRCGISIRQSLGQTSLVLVTS